MTQDIRNVVVVVIDALRRDRVGQYVTDRGLTPAIDALGDRGTVFDYAFSCTNTTDPSVTSIHSGRNPETVVKHHGPFVTDAEKRRAESVTTTPECLQAEGYRTIVTGRTLGRWHANGFDYYPQERFGRYKRRSVGEFLGAISPRLRSVAGSIYEAATDSLSSGSMNEVDEFLDAIENGPLFGMIHLMDTHVPYSHDEAVVEDLLDEHDYPDQDFQSFLREHGDGEYVGDFMTEYTDEADLDGSIGRWFAKYDAAVRKADQKVQTLVEGLKAREIFDDTLLIVTSDHGESLDEHGIYFDHHGLYDPQIRVPLILSGPSVPDTRREEFVQLYDLAPTVLDVLDAEAEIASDGQSLQPLLDGSGEWHSRDWIVTQEAHAQSRISIRTRDYKFIKYVPDETLEHERGDSFACGYCNTIHGSKRELFDLTTDPAERENVVGERPEKAAELESILDEYFSSLEYPATHGDNVEYEDEEELMERLEDLGYR